MQKNAFSLVELSIVLVILGLLVGGILAGQSLIRASELRSVGVDVTRYQTALYAFRDKYFALPGDMLSATSMWGKDAAQCNAQPGTATANGTCNGQGNSMIESGAAASTTAEVTQAWRQLALAGLIEGNYSGIAGSISATDATPVGTTVPAIRYGSGGISIGFYNPVGGDANHYFMNYNTHFVVGRAITSFWTLGSLFRPEDVWNIDTKLDDGKPGTGRVILTYWTACSTSVSNTDFSGDYRLDVTANSCAFRYRNL